MKTKKRLQPMMFSLLDAGEAAEKKARSSVGVCARPARLCC